MYTIRQAATILGVDSTVVLEIIISKADILQENVNKEDGVYKLSHQGILTLSDLLSVKPNYSNQSGYSNKVESNKRIKFLKDTIEILEREIQRLDLELEDADRVIQRLLEKN